MQKEAVWKLGFKFLLKQTWCSLTPRTLSLRCLHSPAIHSLLLEIPCSIQNQIALAQGFSDDPLTCVKSSVSPPESQIPDPGEDSASALEALEVITLNLPAGSSSTTQAPAGRQAGHIPHTPCPVHTLHLGGRGENCVSVRFPMNIDK